MKKKLSLFILLSTAFTFLNINKPVITLNAAEDSIPTPVVQYSSQLSETYYSTTDGLLGNELLNELASISIANHKTYTTYDQIKGGNHYSDMDPNNSNNLIDFYTGWSIQGEWGSGGYPWNREHVWCQSLSGGLYGETGAGADIHHIRPEISSINSTRNNGLYTDRESCADDVNLEKLIYEGISQESAVSQYFGQDTGCYNDGNKYFEPRDAVKGDVARIVMYMYMHYSNEVAANASYSKAGNMQITNIIHTKQATSESCFELLLRWNTLDPVDTFESNRNNYCASVTGLRNPFIDHPEFASDIWGINQEDYVKVSPTYTKMNIGDTYQLSPYTNTELNAFEYVSSNEDVVSVSNSGLLTALKEGSSTITITCGTLSTTFLATVIDSSYQLVTDVNELEIGDQIVIVGQKDTSYYALSKNQKTNNVGGVEVIINGSSLQLNDDVRELTLHEGSIDNTFALYTGEGYLYAASSSSNYLKTQDTIDADASFAFSNAESNTFNIIAQGSNTRNDLRFNYNGGSPLFACYASNTKQSKVFIYKNVALVNEHTHSYSSLINKVDADCLNSGKKAYYTCNGCDKLFIKNNDEYVEINEEDLLIDPLGHSIVNHDAKEPTCEEIGWDAYETCSRCDYSTYKEIKALGHIEVKDEAVEAKCETTGLTEGKHCSVCEKVLVAQEEVAALGHTPVVDAAKAADCENTGLTEGKHCSVCEKVLVAQEVVEALGHTPVVDAAKAADCENTGLTEGKHCSVCEKVLVAQEVVEALGHNIINHDAKEPTCSEVGWDAYETCSRCNHSTYKEIEALGHTEVIDKAIEATCEESGLTEGIHCSKCDEVIIAQQTVPAKGHNYTKEYVEPTCQEYGYTIYSCSCGKTFNSDYIDMKEHNFANWEIKSNPTCNSEGQDVRYCIDCNCSEYRDTRYVGNDNKILVSSPLDTNYFSGKTLLTIGDSITCGVGLSDAAKEYYGKLVADELGMEIINKGISGSVYCYNGLATTNNSLTEDNIRNADVITIFLGINDFNHACKNGHAYGNPTYTSAERSYYQVGEYGNDDISTLYGALKVWCEKIIELKSIKGNENKQFVIITPLISSWNASIGGRNWDQDKVNIHGNTLREYCEAILRVYSEYGIPVFDANMLSGIYYNSDTDNNVGLTGGDGVHINAEGHRLLAQSLIEFLLEGYFYENRSLSNNPHNYVSTQIQSTCDNKGYTKHSCLLCHNIYKDNYVDALGHNYEVSEYVKETCEEDGYTKYVCSNDNSHTYTVEHKAKGHSEVHHNGKEPTCTEEGYKEYVTCENCNYSTYEKIDKISHKYNIEVTEPTCEEKGYTTHTCSACGDTYKDNEVEASGHNYDESTWKKDASGHWHECTVCNAKDEVIPHVPGEEATEENAQECIVCNYVITPSLNHEHNLLLVPSVDATCESNGNIAYYICSNGNFPCGKLFEDENGTIEIINSDDLIINKIGHNYGKWSETITPTLSSTGLLTKVCENNNEHVETFTLPKLNIANYEVVEELSTCIKQGKQTYTYNKDEQTFTYVVDLQLADHTYGTLIQKLDASCMEKGMEEHYLCSICGTFFDSNKEVTLEEALIINALGHNIVNHDAKNATCEEIGWDAYVTCSRCDYTTYEEIAVLGHTEVKDAAKDATCLETGLTEGSHCSVCNKVLVAQEEVAALGHDEVDHEGKAATCENSGWEAYVTCSRCSYTTYKEIAALGHTEVKDAAKDATCLETGLTEGKHCSVCSKVLVKQEVVEALGHTPIVDAAVAADCENTGLTEGSHCSVCSKVLVAQTVVDALGHKEIVDAAKAADCENTGLTEGSHCSVCSKVLVAQNVVDALGHKEVVDAAKAADCENTGLTEGSHCSVCSKVLVAQTVVEALGHTPVVDAAIESTCCENGLTEGSHCSVCNKVLVVQKTTDKKAHTIEVHVGKLASCEESGYKTYVTCSKCDYTTYEAIEALGHDIVTHQAKEPTCIETGWEVYEACNRCNYSTKVEIDKLGHDEINHEGKEATCEETGYNAYVTCNRCNYTTYQEIQALGHECMVSEPISPSCSNDGLTDEIYCGRCNKVLVEAEVIPSYGHLYSNACDTTCNECGYEREVTDHIDNNKDHICDECNSELKNTLKTIAVVGGVSLGSGGITFLMLWFILKKGLFK